MNTANHISPEDLPLIALQFLPESEMADALVHLEHCELCREEIARYQGDLASYAMTSEMHSPPALARERLMRRVAKEKKVIPLERVQARPQPVAADEPVLASRRGNMFDTETYEEPRRSPRASTFVAWSGWAIAAGVALVAGMQFHQRELLQNDINDMSARLTASAAESAKAQDTLKTLTDQGALQVTMHIPPPEGVPATRLPEGHVAYVANKGSLVFVASNLLQLQPYKTYELWVLPSEKGRDPIPAGTFKPDEKGNANVVMPEMPKGVAAVGFGVTIEDDGGAKQPTMPIVLVGM
jgi:hypothetical protein